MTNIFKISLPGQTANSSPAIAPDGNTIYQATFNGTLLAITPQGATQWKFKAGREVKSSPAIADDGTIYVGSYNFHAFKLNAKPSTVGWPRARGGPKQTGETKFPSRSEVDGYRPGG